MAIVENYVGSMPKAAVPGPAHRGTLAGKKAAAHSVHKSAAGGKHRAGPCTRMRFVTWDLVSYLVKQEAGGLGGLVREVGLNIGTGGEVSRTLDAGGGAQRARQRFLSHHVHLEFDHTLLAWHIGGSGSGLSSGR